MKTFTVAFFGHRYIDDFFNVENALECNIRKLINDKMYVEFLVGRNGDFDQMVSSVVLRTRRNLGNNNSSLVLVLPYSTSEFENNEDSFYNYYNEIEICEEAAKSHYKSAIQIRNRSMVDRSDLVICYVKEKEGGAHQTVQYAKSKNKAIINLYEILNKP